MCNENFCVVSEKKKTNQIQHKKNEKSFYLLCATTGMMLLVY